jgi:hypothetical protein
MPQRIVRRACPKLAITRANVDRLTSGTGLTPPGPGCHSATELGADARRWEVA